jgi:LmbE family N-acetylglucosaminyl deacetylase
MLFERPGLRILALSPHVDDVEFGCGGTISKLVERGHHVTLAAFSLCEQSVPRHLPNDVLAAELSAATHLLGLKSEQVITYQYPVRTFPDHRQAILDDLLRLKESRKPEIVLMPAQADTHQDHATLASEGFRAFKDCTLLGYEMPWNNLSFTTTAFSILEERHVRSKIAAIACYASQSARPYSSPDFVRGLARTRGVQVKHEFAEVFEVFRVIM